MIRLISPVYLGSCFKKLVDFVMSESTCIDMTRMHNYKVLNNKKDTCYFCKIKSWTLRIKKMPQKRLLIILSGAVCLLGPNIIKSQPINCALHYLVNELFSNKFYHARFICKRKSLQLLEGKAVAMAFLHWIRLAILLCKFLLSRYCLDQYVKYWPFSMLALSFFMRTRDFFSSTH